MSHTYFTIQLQVHRSVQILRDKQELADAQKELAKLQLVQKESSASSHSQNEERAATPASDPKKSENMSDVHNQQLALALPHQVAPQPALLSRPVEQQQPVAAPTQSPPQNITQPPTYYLSSSQIPNATGQTQHPQSQYLPSDPQYRTQQLQDIPRVTQQPAQTQVNQAPPVASFPQYQQQWPQQMPQQMTQQMPQQMPQQVQMPQQTSMQPQIRPPTTSVYPPYPATGQPTNASPPETLPSSMPMQMPFSGISQPGASRADTLPPYGYGVAGRPVPQQPPPQHMKGTFGAQPGDAYAAAGPHPGLHPGNAYLLYDNEGGRPHHPQQPPRFAQSGYPPGGVSSSQNPQPTVGNLMVRGSGQPQARNHLYNEWIEKLMNMGYRGDHVVSVIQRMEDSGQPIDFNSLLDRLNTNPSGDPQRGWSG